VEKQNSSTVTSAMLGVFSETEHAGGVSVADPGADDGGAVISAKNG